MSTIDNEAALEFKNLKVERREALVIVTVSRPEVLNALNADTIGDFESLMDGIEKEPGTRVVILTGEGERAFVAGADIGELAACDRESGFATARRGQVVFARIESSPVVFIAAVNGFALGGGCELALACDLRLASDSARFGQPEVKLGIIPGYGGTQRLARLVGPGLAKQIIFSGGMIDAAEALRIGLVNEILPASELMERALALAGEIADQAPVAVAAAKTLINFSLNAGAEDGFIREAEAFASICDTEDMREGTAAFAEKRKANFTGK